MTSREIENTVLWRRPLLTLQYAAQELLLLLVDALKYIRRHQVTVLCLVASLILWFLMILSEGPHKKYVTPIQRQIFTCFYWLGLGVLSSVGLGTGLHTFVLYLGPFIASVTIAAYECNSLDFPEPPFPDDIICPEGDTTLGTVSILQIMSKVRVPAVMWGAGTALGELPPYFIARASRLSGCDPDEKEDEFQQLQMKIANNEKLSFVERLKLIVGKVVETLGFLGILACASVPNPLFDLAGIICGHFLVPFWTFFGATLLGKAVIKMHIQQLFVIVACNENLIRRAVNVMANVPVLGPKLQNPFLDFLGRQKKKLHGGGGLDQSGGSILPWLFEKVVLVMVLYFLLSIVNSMAQSYHTRLCKRRRHLKLAED